MKKKDDNVPTKDPHPRNLKAIMNEAKSRYRDAKSSRSSDSFSCSDTCDDDKKSIKKDKRLPSCSDDDKKSIKKE